MDEDARDERLGPPALGDIARELRAGVGADFRADAEAGERQAAQAALRRRHLSDVAAEAAARGDTVTVELRDRRFSGRVEHTARDLLTLRTAAGSVHINLAAALLVRTRGDGPQEAPRSSADAVPSFKARLYELEMTRGEVAVGLTVAPGEMRGRIRAVASDHLLVETVDGQRCAVGLAAVHWVRASGPDGTGRVT